MDRISLDGLAEALGVHRSNARKIAIANGVLPERRQMPGAISRQRVLTWTKEQVEQIRKARAKEGFQVPAQ